jgi:hypothetical protein
MQVIFMHHICYMWIHIYVDNIFILRLMHFVNRILNKKKTDWFELRIKLK